MKRLFDLLASFLGLIFLCPFFLGIALAIKLNSKGPVIYSQTRVGRSNKDFKLFKFRTMYVGTDDKGSLTIGAKDARITSVGLFLRRSKLDELPQLWNVLVGQMSLVGPRPEVRQFVDCYTPEQMRVLQLRPGVTAAASIKYRNENALLEQGALQEGCTPEVFYKKFILPDKMKMNLEYVDHHPFWRDIQLIFETVFPNNS